MNLKKSERRRVRERKCVRKDDKNADRQTDRQTDRIEDCTAITTTMIIVFNNLMHY